jgi:hypothetical protein
MSKDTEDLILEAGRFFLRKRSEEAEFARCEYCECLGVAEGPEADALFQRWLSASLLESSPEEPNPIPQSDLGIAWIDEGDGNGPIMHVGRRADFEEKAVAVADPQQLDLA